MVLAMCASIRHYVQMTGELLHAALRPLAGRTDVTTSEVLIAVITAFNRETGASIDPASLSVDDRERLREYIVRSHMEGGASLFHRTARLDRLPLYPDTAAKLSWLHQHRCAVCPEGDEFATNTFPVGVPPWSHQCSKDVGPALRAAIDASPRYATHFQERLAHGPLCIRLVFVLGDGATMKDCDNMAKGVLDAFEGLLYDNDTQVEHLDLLKVTQAPGSPGYILVRRASTRVNDHRDVLVEKHATLAWMEDLDIARYL
jgi:hypothetical protein